MPNKQNAPFSLYESSREYLKEQEKKNELLAEIAGVEYEAPGDIPNGKYVIEKRMLDAAQKENEILEELADGGGAGVGANKLAIDYATDVLSLKKGNTPIANSGVTLPAYGLSYDSTTGGLTLTKNGSGVQGQTVSIPDYGSPLCASSAAGMTETDKVYVYTGETSGSLTNGHWYYYDGDSWEDGGTYNSAGIDTDTTLLVSGAPADAKATGDAVADLNSALDNTEDIIDNSLSVETSLELTFVSNKYITATGDTSTSTAFNLYSVSLVGIKKVKVTSGNYQTVRDTRNIAFYSASSEFSSCNCLGVGDVLVKNDNTPHTYEYVVPTGTVTMLVACGENYTDNVGRPDVKNIEYKKIADYAELEKIAPAFAQETPNDIGSYVANDNKIYLLPNGHIAGETIDNTFKTNTTVCKEIEKINKYSYERQPFVFVSGGFTGDVGEDIETTTNSNFKRTVFVPEQNVIYRFKYTNVHINTTAAYIKTVDANGKVLEDFDIVSKNAASTARESVHSFGSNVAQVWFRVRSASPYSIEKLVSRLDIAENDINELEENKSYYDCAIPDSGTYDDSTFSDVYDAYDALCTAYPNIISREEDIGEDADGNGIRYYKIQKIPSSVRTISDSTNLYNTYCTPKHCLLSSGVHGNEKSGVWGLYYFVKDFIESKAQWAVDISNDFIFHVVPVIDPWGYNNNSRNNKNDVNINRDYQSANPEPETSAVLSLIASIDSLYCAIDSHSTEGNYGYIATRRTNPDVSDIMKIATRTISECAPRWKEYNGVMSFPGNYPFAYACLSVNDGTLPDYLIDSNITTLAVTVETIKYDGEKQKPASKMSADYIGNILPKLVKIGD